MPRTIPAVLALAAVPLSLTACAGSHSAAAAKDAHPGAATAAAGADGVQQVSIDTTNMFRFVPATVHMRVGKLRIAVSDSGAYPHNISFPDLHATSATVSGDPGRQKTTFTVTFTRPGTYRFVCTFHSSAGMTGQVVVS
jgi:plastocyanin